MKTKHIFFHCIAMMACGLFLAGCCEFSEDVFCTAYDIVSGPAVEAFRHDDGTYTLKNRNTGKAVLKKVVIQPVYTDSDFLGLYSKGAWGYYDKVNGNSVIGPRYEHAWPFSEGKAAVLDDKGCLQFINKEGEVLFGFPYPHRGALPRISRFGTDTAPFPTGTAGTGSSIRSGSGSSRPSMERRPSSVTLPW